MKTDQKRLVDFVMREAVDKNLALQALAVIEPYFMEANVGLYPLVVTWHVDQGSTKAALDLAFGEPVSDLQILAGTAGLGLGANDPPPGDLVPTAMLIRDLFRDDLFVELGDENYENLLTTLQESLGMFVCSNMMSVYPDFFQQLEPNEAYTLSLTPMVCIYYLLGFAMLGDVGMYNRLKPLVELCRHAVPAGRSSSEPGKWVLLAG